MCFFTYFDFESVLPSNTHSWLATSYYRSGIAEALPVFATHYFYLISAAFFSLYHDKNFETNEKSSNRNNESITPFYNPIHWLVWWVVDESIFFFLVYLISLLFVHFSVIKLRYFWWNYFLNTFCLLVALLRLVCLLMVGQ